jgi:hypothetical protein
MRCKKCKKQQSDTGSYKSVQTFKALTPSIHIIVVVVSPTTLPLPPALLAATIAAIYPICTFFLNTTIAIAPPISAAAILSRNDDNIKMKIKVQKDLSSHQARN